jgi:hypothetical protein
MLGEITGRKTRSTRPPASIRQSFSDRQPPPSIRGRVFISQLLCELLEARELVLSAALPTGTNDARSDQSWYRDFAAGQVALTTICSIPRSATTWLTMTSAKHFFKVIQAS